jgi:serine/threonine-protein kinase
VDALTQADQRAEFAKTWEAMGLDDRTVDTKNTETMRPSQSIQARAQTQSLHDLPRLLGDQARDAKPEIRIKHKIGEGGMGLVSLAHQLPMGRDVAVKGLRNQRRNHQMRLSLLAEGWTTGLLEHPNIVPVYTVGRDADGEPIIIMKRIEGVAWDELLRNPGKAPREFDSDDPLDWHIDILSQVCNAVHYAHSKGIIHRDLKPENVMIGEFGEVYVLDWGIAVGLNRDPSHRLPSIDQASAPAGTPPYMAPEMVNAEGQNLSTRTDVYLLGAILHEILTGQPPHTGETLQTIMFEAFCSHPKDYDESVPGRLADICRRAMAADPGQRFVSAEAFRHALVGFKRHREALVLADEAHDRLDSLRDVLGDGPGDDNRDQGRSEAMIYKLFGECRFGFEQALRVEPDNDMATSGFQSALEMMAERELSRGAFQAASLLLADFPHPRPGFERRLDELGERLKTRQDEFESLQKIKHEVDPEIGRTSRSIFAMALGVVFCGLGLLIHFGYHLWGMPISYELIFGHAVFLVVLIGAAFKFGRAWLFQNSANRRIMVGLWVMLVGASFYRGIVWIAELPLLPAIAGEVLYYGVGGSILGVAQDRRIIAAAAPYFAAGIMGAIWPEYVMLIFAITNLVALWILAWMLWPRATSP